MAPVRRLLRGLLALSWLAFIGLQAVHTHAKAADAPDSCVVCALGHDAVGQQANASPRVVSAPVVVALAVFVQPDSRLVASSSVSDRAPPRA